MTSSRMIGGRYVFVRHNKQLIQQGHYFFANSHRPAHQLDLPRKTFTVTILRDPVARIRSHYRYLKWARTDPRAPRLDPSFRSLENEMKWLGRGFSDFLRDVPKKHLFAQLWMFSPELDPDEATERALGCSAIGFTERFPDLLTQLSQRLDLPLAVRHERRFRYPVELTTAKIEQAQELLAPETAFVRAVRKRKLAS